MGRHSDGRAAGPPVLPPRSLLIALAAAIVVTAIILGTVAWSHRGSTGPGRPAGDLTPSPTVLLSPSPRPAGSATR